MWIITILKTCNPRVWILDLIKLTVRHTLRSTGIVIFRFLCPSAVSRSSNRPIIFFIIFSESAPIIKLNNFSKHLQYRNWNYIDKSIQFAFTLIRRRINCFTKHLSQFRIALIILFWSRKEKTSSMLISLDYRLIIVIILVRLLFNCRPILIA